MIKNQYLFHLKKYLFYYEKLENKYLLKKDLL